MDFPKIWKQARITPIPKVNNPNVQQWLPAHFLSKIDKRIVFNQLTEFIESQDLLSSKISGFRKGRSLYVICATCDMRCYYQSEETWVVRFWRIFPKRFSKSYLEWTINYLCEREQFVQVDDKRSSSLKANFRVTQGSIMGPLFFNIYASVLQSTVTNRCHQYAVDTTLYAHAKPIELS